MENNFSNNLKHLRIEKGLTQKELGKKLNKDYSTIGKWENGTRSPVMEDVIKIADFFNISLQELIGGKHYNKYDNQKIKKLLFDKEISDDDISEDDLKKLIDFAIANKDYLLDKKN